MFRQAVLFALILAGILAFTTVSAARRPASRPKPAQITQNVAGRFNYYVLALSWSPDYCAAKGKNDPQQCDSNRGLGFVLHGLWPQSDRGYPQNCTTEAFDPKMQQQFPDLYPSSTLLRHEWEKHGTCAGLSQLQYHQLSQALKDRVKIPDRYVRPNRPVRVTPANFKQEFVNANPGMSFNSIAPSCSGSGRFLQEVLVCYTKEGKPGICGEEVLRRSQKSCGQPDFLVRNIR
jgi:ribonuclease T2